MTNAISTTDRKLIASLRLVFETEVAISAAKIDEYKAKNPELADAIQTLNDELTKKKLQKHMAWGVKQLQAGEEVTAILEGLDEFEVLLKKRRGIGEADPVTRKRESAPFLKGSERDIFFYTKLKDLTEKVSEAKQAVEERDVEEISKEDARKKIREEGVEYIYHDADFLVARPLTKRASCHYGMGTKWCISDPERDYFDQYSNDNRYFFFVIDRSKDASGLAVPDESKPGVKINDPWAKVAFVFEKNNPDFLQAWDTPDKQIPIPRVLNHYTKEYGRKIYDLIHLMYKSVDSLPNTWQYDVTNSKDPNRIFEILKEQGEDNEDVRIAVANRPELPAEAQVKLAKDSSARVRSALVCWANRVEEVQELLSTDPDKDVRVALAKHVTLVDSKDHGRFLPRPSHPRHGLTRQDPSKASKAAMALAADKSAAVIQALVNGHINSVFPPDFFNALLSSDLAGPIASSLVYKATTPEQLIRIIALDPELADSVTSREIANDEVIEAALATGLLSLWKVNSLMERLKITPERLEKMLADPEKSYANRLNLAKLEKITSEMLDRVANAGPMSTDLAAALASRENASLELLNNLAALPDATGNISWRIAENPSITAEIATLLSNKEIASPGDRRKVDIALAESKATPADVLATIRSRSSGDSDPRGSVAEALSKNENTTAEVLDAIFEQFRDRSSMASSPIPSVREDILTSVAINKNTSGETRRILAEMALKDRYIIIKTARSPLTPLDILERYAAESPWLVGEGLARNPVSTPEILRKVFNYRSGDVRQHGSVLETTMIHPNFPMDLLLEIASKPGTRLGKHAKEVLKLRADRPAPPKRTRKPKAAPAAEAPMAAEEVVGVEATYLKEAVHSLAEIFHLLPVSAFALLAIEEAALLLEE
jgi:hypothetical protein